MTSVRSSRSMRVLAAGMAAAVIVTGLPGGSITAQTSPTRTPAAQTPTPTPVPLPPYYDQLPRDKKGRVLGYPRAPILNYTPTMVTGKRCPRVRSWTVRLTSKPNEKPAGVFSNPCVVQNALDDTLSILFFYPLGHWDTRAYRRDVLPLLNKDPMALRMPRIMREEILKDAQDTSKDRYVVCDKPVYMLIDVSPEQPVHYQEDTQKFWPNSMFIRMFVAAGNAEPFTCTWYDANTGKAVFEQGAREQDMTGPIDWKRGLVRHWIVRYSPQLSAWSEGSLGFLVDEEQVSNYREKVLELLARSPIKP